MYIKKLPEKFLENFDIYCKIYTMGKIIRLTESDLMRIVKRVINENEFDSSNINEYFGGPMKDNMVPIIDRVIDKLNGVKNELTNENGGVYNREDTIKIEFIDGLLRGKDMKLLLKSYAESMKHRFNI